MKHIIKILVYNEPGVMSHICGLFSRRGYNIDSIAVGETLKEEFSCIIIVLRVDNKKLNQIQSQLLNLPSVFEVENLSYSDSISRELVIINIKAEKNDKTEIINICNAFEAKIVELTKTNCIIQYTGNSRQVSSIIEVLNYFEIEEIVRTGEIGLKRLN